MMVSFTRFARAASPSTDRGTEKRHLDKRFSSLFTLPAQPQDSASPPVDGQNEKTEAETDTESTTNMNPESNPTRMKIDRRFSTLFMSALQASRPSTQTKQMANLNHEESPHSMRKSGSSSSHDETSWTFTFPLKSSLSRRKSLKLLFRRIFRSAPSSTSDESEGTLCESSEEISSRLWADLIGDPSLGTTLPPPSSSIKQRSQTTVVVLPSLRNAPSKSRPNGGVEIVGILQSSGSKRADSKFSSITSLPSLQSLSLSLPTSNYSGEGGMIKVSASGLLMLESCSRRIGRGLARQEYLTTHLSQNLLSLFCKKATQIQIHRFRPDTKTSLLSSLSRIKDATGKTFLRKAVFLQRSQEIASQITKILETSRAKAKSVTKSELIAGGGGEGSEGSDGESPASPLIELEDRIFDLLKILAGDVDMQRELDAGLRKLVIGKAGEKMWCGGSCGGEEKTQMDRFCAFVEGRLSLIEGAYGRLEMLGGRMRGVERGV